MNHSQSQLHHCLTSLLHSSSKSPLHLKQIHAHVIRHHLAADPHLTSLLISFSSSSPLYALSLFRHFPSRPTPPLFNAVVRALTDSSHYHLALSTFTLLLTHPHCLKPTRLSLPFAIRAAASLSSPPSTLSLHTVAIKPGFDLDPFVRTTIADGYCKLGSPELALQVFDETPEWHRVGNVILWNVGIKACCELGRLGPAREMFEAMPEKSVSSWNCLIHGFVRKGDLEYAEELFEKMPERNVFSWTTMVVGFSRSGDARRALSLFDRMVDAGGVRPNAFTVSAVLAACARVGALEAGIRIHEYVSGNGFSKNMVIGTALVDMYSKCGKIDSASQVFNGMRSRDISTWTAMIMGWAVHGRWQKAMHYFEEMKRSSVQPDDGVFLAMLVACLHTGKVEHGLKIFDCMSHDYNIQPALKHYTCIVDLLGRAGKLDEALQLVNSMPIEPDFVIWGALFSACRAHKNVPLAELAAEKLLKLKPKHSGGYVFLSNVYSGAEQWEDAERVRVYMKKYNVEKSPGWSSIEISGNLYQLVAGDQSHPQSKEIYEKLEEMVTRARELGYKPGTEWVLHNIEEEDKEDSLGCHSEKLALGLGILTTSEGEEIRIVKNLKVCGDCHSLMKLVSRIYGRVIVLRDMKRFHHFKDGQCSCGDYW